MSREVFEQNLMLLLDSSSTHGEDILLPLYRINRHRKCTKLLLSIFMTQIRGNSRKIKQSNLKASQSGFCFIKLWFSTLSDHSGPYFWSIIFYEQRKDLNYEHFSSERLKLGKHLCLHARLILSHPSED